MLALLALLILTSGVAAFTPPTPAPVLRCHACAAVHERRPCLDASSRLSLTFRALDRTAGKTACSAHAETHSRRSFLAALPVCAVSLASPLRVGAQAPTDAAEPPAAKDAKEGTIYGQNPKQLMTEGGLTLLGFAGIRMGCTCVRSVS